MPLTLSSSWSKGTSRRCTAGEHVDLVERIVVIDGRVIQDVAAVQAAWYPS
jgi:hypothetical protein